MSEPVSFKSLLDIRKEISELQTQAYLSKQSLLAERLAMLYTLYDTLVIKPCHTDEQVV